MRTHVDLFSGIGGFSLAARWAGVETIAFAEIDPYASRVLERHFPGVRNYGDVRNVPSLSAWLLTGGVPCQPASIAGKRQGAADDRWLWPEALAVVENGNYEWVLFENPAGILSLNDGVEFEHICLALEGYSYSVQPIVIPAAAVRAKHRRERVWILAHSEHVRRNATAQRGGTSASVSNNTQGTDKACKPSGVCSPEYVADSDTTRLQRTTAQWEVQGWRVATGHGGQIGAAIRNPTGERLPQWAGGEMGQPWPLTEFERSNGDGKDREIERDFRGMAHGVSRRVDRLKCLGNAIVPQVAYQLIKRMIEAEEKQP